MADKETELTQSGLPTTVTDGQIVTERIIPRRSFLNRTGALLTGAAGVVAGVRGSSLSTSAQDDPDKKPSDPDKKPSDPDKKPSDPDKKPSDPDKKPSDPDKKPSDPDKKKATDPDKKKSSDPDKKKATDPDKAGQRP